MKDVNQFDALQKPPIQQSAPITRKLKVCIKVNLATSDYDLENIPTEGDLVVVTHVTLTGDGKLQLPKFSAAGTFFQLIV